MDIFGPNLGGAWTHWSKHSSARSWLLYRYKSNVQEFASRGVKLAALSCDSAESHRGWIKDILAYNNLDEFSYPIIADPGRNIATLYGMMDPDEKDAQGLPLTCRSNI